VTAWLWAARIDDEVAQEDEGTDDDAVAFWFEVLVFVHVVPV
jgi:hypothetical protein